MCLKHFIYLSHWSYSKIKLESDKRKIPRKVLKKKNKFKAQRINFERNKESLNIVRGKNIRSNHTCKCTCKYFMRQAPMANYS